MQNRVNVSILIPCKNERPFLAACLDSILGNDYPHDALEILVIDGMSTDGTRDILRRYASQYPFLKIIDNPSGIIPAGLNLGIQRASGEIVIRMDAHAAYRQDYISRSVEAIATTGADIVGGQCVMTPRSDSFLARAIAKVLSTRFGVGNAYYRLRGQTQARWVDTVPFLCCKRELFDRVGLFNEHLIRSQDIEFSRRVTANGGRILFLPEIVSWYYARSSLPAFLAHTWRTGEWVTLPFLYSKSLPVSWRHLVPAGFVLSLAVAGALSPLSAGWRVTEILVLAAYLLTSVAVSGGIAYRHKDARLLVALPAIFAGLHLAYGLGSIWGALEAMGIFMRRTLFTRDRRVLKRLFDIAFCVGAGILALVPMILIGALIKLQDGGPVFYRGARIGRGGRPFRIWKFRTMVPGADQLGGCCTAANDVRVTPLGRWLRRGKWDELPQLMNVLSGEMSVVGPRPETGTYVSRYRPEDHVVLTVKPGITDWASLWDFDEEAVLAEGPSPEQLYESRVLPGKLELQKHYVRCRSFWQDARIVAFTIVKLLRPRWLPAELQAFNGRVRLPRAKEKENVAEHRGAEKGSGQSRAKPCHSMKRIS